jgi:hypothetical protein
VIAPVGARLPTFSHGRPGEGEADASSPRFPGGYGPAMRRYRFDGGLGPVFRMPKVASSWRGSSWTRTAKAFKAVHLQCAKCGAIADLECDHIVPRDQGGSDDWSNLQSLCKACHAAKSAVERGKRPGRGGSGAWKNPIG